MSANEDRPSSRLPRGFLAALVLAVAPASAQSLDEALRDITESLVTQIEASEIEKIAVVDFTDLNGYESALGDFISEELVTSFFVVGSGRFDIVERRELSRVLEEQNLGSSGLFDPDTIANLGRLLGIQAIVTGSITYLDADVRLNARMIGVDTGRVFAAASATVRNDPIVQQLGRQVARADSPSGIAPQRFDVSFNNSFMQAVVTSASVSQNGKQFRIALDLRNISSEPLQLAVLGTGSRGAGLTSNGGEEFRLYEITGLQRVGGTNVPIQRIANLFSLVDPGSHASIVVSFVLGPFDDRVRGDTFSFASEMIRLTGEQTQSFSVGVSGIRIN